MADLSITIGADSSDLDREIRDVERQLQTLERRREARVRIGADVGDLDRRINQTTSNLTQLRNNLNQTSQSTQNFNRQTANGSNTLTQFSRIAQDAPFGIMGIGNNLTATAEAFASLSQSAGGARGALSAVVQSLTGVGGVLLAVSLVTTALTVMSQKGITIGDVFDKLSGNFDETKKALSDINKEAAKTSGEEIAGLRALTEVAKDNTLSMQKRLIAVKKLQDEYPAYFGNLTREQILNGNVATAIDDVSKALRARAVASAIAGKLGELASKRLELEERRERLILGIQRAQLDVAKDKNKISTSGGGIAGQGGGFTTVDDRSKNALISLSEEYKQIQKEIRELDAVSKKYSDRENQATKDSILLDEEKVKSIKKKKVGYTPDVIGVKSELDPAGLVDLSGQVVQIAKNVQGAEGVIATSMGNINVAVDSSLIDTLEAMYRFNDEMNDLITNSLTSTFSNLGSAIGEALASGQNVFQAIGSSLLQSLGSFISDMGDLLIKYGTLAVAKGVLDQAIASGGPISIGAGIAAIAVGVALKAAGGAISSKAKGGLLKSNGSMSSGGSYSSPASSASYSSSSSATGGTFVFEIEGTKLVGVLQNTLDKNKRLGGNLPI